MTTPPETSNDVASRPTRDNRVAVIELTMFIGLMLSLVGIGFGITIATHSRPAGCADDCSHPQLAEGMGLIVVSALLGVLIYLVGYTASHLVGSALRSASDTDSAQES